jgi:hypothetical protein
LDAAVDLPGENLEVIEFLLFRNYDQAGSRNLQRSTLVWDSGGSAPQSAPVGREEAAGK